jgi:hypothetical protein
LQSFQALIAFFLEKEGQRILSGSSFGFKVSLIVFLLFKFGDCSTISCVVVVLVTIVTPSVGTLLIFRRLAYTTGNRNLFLYFTSIEKGLGPLVRLIFNKFSNI